jgi:hypothetical protein
MPESVATQCKGCHRAVFVEHLDRDGNCCFCQKPAAATRPEAPKVVPIDRAGERE